MLPDRHTGSSRPHSRTPLWLLTVISIATVAVTAFAGTAQAAPNPNRPTTYDVSVGGGAFSLTVHNGSISTNSGSLVIRNSAGAEKFRMPLFYRKEYRQFPIDARTVGNKATLIPSRNVARSTPVNPIEVEALRVSAANQVDVPKTKQERDDQALARFNQVLGAGMTISQIVGIALGAVIGGIVGCVPGLAIAGVGCIPGFLTGASIGAVVGLLLGGGGTLLIAGIQYFQTINSPFVPPK
ncbi:glycine zipper family protein [Gordonia sp. CPCC 206044]|uniref:glycine zipper family protein n=1 Tax=Gordonia sp. CPCC 206044 TaxID=3140793 RepID=UPI003AF38854